MDLIDELKALSSKISKQRDLLQTEEATKNAFVLPFITALGYNVFDPTEVTPELTADVGTKKGEKVDYAILKDGKPIILFECKWSGINLDKEHKSQLYRYFSVTEARFAVLTNGIIYRFYTDIDEPNKMDAKPFMELDMLNIRESAVEDLKIFSKSFFNLDENLTAATELKYTREIKQILAAQMAKPSEEFVKFFAAKVYSGKLTQSIKQQFAELIKKALQHYLSDKVNERLESALAVEEPPVQSNNSKVEDEGLKIIRDILNKIVEPERIALRETANYFGIVFDGNTRKPICRLYFNNPKKKRLGVFDENKQEKKVHIAELQEISQYADKLKGMVKRYLQETLI